MGFFSIVSIPLFQALTDLSKMHRLAILLCSLVLHDQGTAHETGTVRCDTQCSCGLAV